MERQSEQVNVPSEHVAVVAMFADREIAETAVEALLAEGFSDDQISLDARGARTDDSGKFAAGGAMVPGGAEARGRAGDRLLRAHGGREGATTGTAGAGEVGGETCA